MKDQLQVSLTFKIITGVLIALGIAAFAIGFLSDPSRTWANYLLNNYYFFSLAMGGIFFLVIQNISQSGWSSGFLRVSEAMMSYIPVAAVFFILIYFGIHDLYHWSHEDAVADDPVLQHKADFLNVPFFMIRLVIYFVLWIIFVRILRKLSLNADKMDPENTAGILSLFNKNELFSKIFIFILAITFSLSAIDWIMSLDPHWYSTIFALKNMVAAFLHGASILILIVFILYRRGYFPFLNKYHLHDFARYLFMLSIVSVVAIIGIIVLVITSAATISGNASKNS